MMKLRILKSAAHGSLGLLNGLASDRDATDLREDDVTAPANLVFSVKGSVLIDVKLNVLAWQEHIVLTSRYGTRGADLGQIGFDLHELLFAGLDSCLPILDLVVQP